MPTQESKTTEHDGQENVRFAEKLIVRLLRYTGEADELAPARRTNFAFARGWARDRDFGTRADLLVGCSAWWYTVLAILVV